MWTLKALSLWLTIAQPQEWFPSMCGLLLVGLRALSLSVLNCSISAVFSVLQSGLLLVMDWKHWDQQTECLVPWFSYSSAEPSLQCASPTLWHTQVTWLSLDICYPACTNWGGLWSEWKLIQTIDRSFLWDQEWLLVCKEGKLLKWIQSWCWQPTLDCPYLQPTYSTNLYSGNRKE
jgi:hypothetical protein